MPTAHTGRTIALGCVLFLWCAAPTLADDAMTLWYRKPARRWTEAMPMGNGRLGAMVFGSAPKERLQLNEESLWAGEPFDAYPDDFAKHLKVVQELVLDGKIAEARAYGAARLVKKPTSFRSYEPLGDLWIELKHGAEVTDYRRELSLADGIARVHYKAGGVTYTREVLISAGDDCLAVRLTADKPGALSGRVWLTRAKDMRITAGEGGRLAMDGQIVDIPAPKARDDNRGGSGPGGKHMKFAARLVVRPEGGSVTPDKDALVLEGAEEVVLLLTAATDFSLAKMNFDRTIDPGEVADGILAKAAKRSWTDIRRDHVKEHRGLFDRVSIDIGPSPNAKLPTDERLAAMKKGAADPALLAQYFQFGRYLLMASSRAPGRVPANLQGLWNDRMWAPWEADYHLNINLQMNYWPADLCNLSETVDSLAGWFGQVARKGRRSAKTLYGAPGWVAFHAVNLFGRTSPSGSNLNSQFKNGSLDPLAGAWMAMTLWRHYEYTRDRAFLAERAYPVLKGAAEFLLHYLVEDRDGRLVIVPSSSPENAYIHPRTGKAVRITRGSTYHTTIVRVVFEAVIDASRELGKDRALAGKLAAARKRLPPIKIGADGTIQEWIEDYKEQNPHHRHVSHLLGLHPFSLITPARPALFEAARKTLQRRGTGGDVGWSNAWKTSFYARLHDGEQAHAYLNRLVGRNAFPNLFDACWPGRLFQIDGNFGGTAGLAEMLLQSRLIRATAGRAAPAGRQPLAEIHLLPALPKAWPAGHIHGLKARGGFVVDIDWKDGKLTRARLRSQAGLPCRLLGAAGARITSDGTPVELTGDKKAGPQFVSVSGRAYDVEP